MHGQKGVESRLAIQCLVSEEFNQLSVACQCLQCEFLIEGVCSIMECDLFGVVVGDSIMEQRGCLPDALHVAVRQ